MGSYSLAQKERIKNRNEFQKVFKKGRLFQANFLEAFILKNNLDFNRVGIAFRKEAWNKKAVLRNKAKRIIREGYRKNKHLLKPGFDIILIGRNLDKKNLLAQVEDELKKLFQAIE